MHSNFTALLDTLVPSQLSSLMVRLSLLTRLPPQGNVGQVQVLTQIT